MPKAKNRIGLIFTTDSSTPFGNFIPSSFRGVRSSLYSLRIRSFPLSTLKSNDSECFRLITRHIHFTYHMTSTSDASCILLQTLVFFIKITRQKEIVLEREQWSISQCTDILKIQHAYYHTRGSYYMASTSH